MKTPFFILIFTVMMFHVGAVSDVSYTIENNKTLTVETFTWKSSQLKIQIKDAFGTIILEENPSNTSRYRKYNLKNLPDGNYTLEMSNELRISSKPFVINGNNVMLSPDHKTIYKPVVFWQKDYLDVNLLALGSESTLKIYNDKGETVYSQVLNTPAVHKRYNISQLPKGAYTVSVGVNERHFDFHYAK